MSCISDIVLFTEQKDSQIGDFKEWFLGFFYSCVIINPLGDVLKENFKRISFYAGYFRASSSSFMIFKLLRDVLGSSLNFSRKIFNLEFKLPKHLQSSIFFFNFHQYF